MLLRIDGNYGEGGGQILRTSLALSIITRRPIQIYNIRKGRKVPGLQPQHLTSVNAAATISGAQVTGNELMSELLTFAPRSIKAGSYTFDVGERKGSAGSVSLVLQTLIPALIFSQSESRITLIGGTHVPWSPPLHYLQQVFCPTVARMGVYVQIELDRWGWYPQGGGKVRSVISPAPELKPLNLLERGQLKRLSGVSAVSNLPASIAQRQRDQAIRLLRARNLKAEIELTDAPAIGKGTFVFLLAEFEHTVAGFGALGAPGKPAEAVAEEACRNLSAYLDSEAALDPHLADQLIPYLALARGRSQFTTSKITRHLLTNIWVVEQFLPVKFDVEGGEGSPGKVTVQGNYTLPNSAPRGDTLNEPK